jgi:hypothetical protein
MEFEFLYCIVLYCIVLHMFMWRGIFTEASTISHENSSISHIVELLVLLFLVSRDMCRNCSGL